MSYLHQNYPPFCDDAENFDDLMHYLSDADALMRMEGDAVSPSLCYQEALADLSGSSSPDMP